MAQKQQSITNIPYYPGLGPSASVPMVAPSSQLSPSALARMQGDVGRLQGDVGRMAEVQAGALPPSELRSLSEFRPGELVAVPLEDATTTAGHTAIAKSASVEFEYENKVGHPIRLVGVHARALKSDGTEETHLLVMSDLKVQNQPAFVDDGVYIPVADAQGEPVDIRRYIRGGSAMVCSPNQEIKLTVTNISDGTSGVDVIVHGVLVCEVLAG